MLVWRTIYHDLGRELGLCEVIVCWIVFILIFDVEWLYDHVLLTLLFACVVHPNFSFAKRVTEEGPEKEIAVTIRFIIEQLIMFILIYYAPLHLEMASLFLHVQKKKLCCSSEKMQKFTHKKKKDFTLDLTRHR
jgi:hypothetical protein